MQILNAEQTARALPYAQLVPAVAQAARELAQQQIQAPERLVVPMTEGGVLLAMPAVGRDFSVTKLVTVHPRNAAQGLPVIQGEVVVMDTASGRRLALLDGPTVTARRTAAVTLLGIQTLAPHTPKTALLIGTGAQAAAHVDALVEHLGLAQFWIAGRSLQAAQAFCAALQARHPHARATAMAVSEMDNVLPATDLVLALTTSRTPVIPAHIGAQTLAIGVGAFKPDMAEFPPPLLHCRQIVVDDLGGARHEAGDLLQAGVDWAQVRDLSSVLDTPLAPGAAVPVFKTVGQAAWDLAAARVALAAIQRSN
ncbi:1-piperideine-2-carboxylate/1-pyrroline-2-carboxylate reductase [NAD(P)H] [Rhodoferax ferrireducens]|uniref:1-piperideine-2-carboxylate/1-pyrroline-2-carboxylate reductase [NAD(P)H] n=1 Tax=Rhodoferax ferrireducens TaxID=192843 RepID=A0ABU2C7E7_9BURK|nr:delta(1)-pyrroline-2-carboxylate reductase family protein [Rhodoferax ferrireducens]MDR7377250.1 1-piperideine-2-carboxylate/1-pyrroline-2-carboxylate reductase [NAD(P)H] [Rhodoferax ferrireducens]